MVSVAVSSSTQLRAEVTREYQYISLHVLCHWHALLHGVKFSIMIPSVLKVHIQLDRSWGQRK